MAAASSQDLLDQVDFSGLECLNEQSSHPAANALKQGLREQDELFLESDADEQLLLKIPFQQFVKLSSIIIKGPTDGSGPKKVKLFINLPSLGFSDVEGSTAPVQEFELTPAQLEGEPIPLKLVKFQRVTHLAIFVESNVEGTDTSKVLKVGLFGTSGEAMDVAKIKKVES